MAVAHRLRAYNSSGLAVVFADMPEEGPAEFEAPEPISLVVFYSGPPESEFVCGSQELDNEEGNILVEFVE